MIFDLVLLSCFSLERLRTPRGPLLLLCFTDVAFAVCMFYDVATFFYCFLNSHCSISKRNCTDKSRRALFSSVSDCSKWGAWRTHWRVVSATLQYSNLLAVLMLDTHKRWVTGWIWMVDWNSLDLNKEKKIKKRPHGTNPKSINDAQMIFNTLPSRLLHRMRSLFIKWKNDSLLSVQSYTPLNATLVIVANIYDNWLTQGWKTRKTAGQLWLTSHAWGKKIHKWTNVFKTNSAGVLKGASRSLT